MCRRFGSSTGTGSVELLRLVEFGEERTVRAMLRVYVAVWFMCYVAAYALDFVVGVCAL